VFLQARRKEAKKKRRNQMAFQWVGQQLLLILGLLCAIKS
jgi:hypothetical protein